MVLHVLSHQLIINYNEQLQARTTGMFLEVLRAVQQTAHFVMQKKDQIHIMWGLSFTLRDIFMCDAERGLLRLFLHKTSDIM